MHRSSTPQENDIAYMAYKGKVIRNSKTGQQILFIQTAKDTEGKVLEMESTYAAHSKEPPPHYHPQQTEEFEIISGEMSVRLNGAVRVLRGGDKLAISPNTTHSMWNHGKEKAVVNWKVFPALDTEHFFEIALGLSETRRTNADGMPGILQVALLADKFKHVFRLTSPPLIVQKIIFGLLTPLAKILGYHTLHKKYLD